MIDLTHIAQIAIEDASKIALTGNGETRASLTRYRVLRLLGNYTVPELRAALTQTEQVTERQRLGRALRKDDYVQLLAAKVLVENVEG